MRRTPATNTSAPISKKPLSALLASVAAAAAVYAPTHAEEGDYEAERQLSATRVANSLGVAPRDRGTVRGPAVKRSLGLGDGHVRRSAFREDHTNRQLIGKRLRCDQCRGQVVDSGLRRAALRDERFRVGLHEQMGEITQFDHQQMLTVEPGKRLVELAARVAGEVAGGHGASMNSTPVGRPTLSRGSGEPR